MLAEPRISIIIPAYDEARNLEECLTALRAAASPGTEIIVVDDASSDDTPEVAARMGARAVRLASNAGPAAARNAGAQQAAGDVLLFVDADVVVPADLLDRVARIFAERPQVAAVFGSYDARPRAQGVVSQYRNLLHHFVHQQGNPDASTFWTGCGAIRRVVFEAAGGFDEGRRSMEDVELGYRLHQAGYRIFLDRTLQVTHLKTWTLCSLVRVDVTHRAVPWSRLLRERRGPDDLNLRAGERLSVMLACLASLSLLLVPIEPALLAMSAAAVVTLVLRNRSLFAFFRRERGLGFVLQCVPLVFLYYLCSGLGYAYVWIENRLASAGRITPC